LRFNKKSIINKDGRSITIIFFYELNSFLDFEKSIDPFSAQNVFHNSDYVAIIVRGLNAEGYGCRLYVGSETSEIKFEELSALPDKAKIHATIHLITTNDFIVDPSVFVLLKISGDVIVLDSLVKKSIQALSACLVNEFYSIQKIVLKGIKRTESSLIVENLPGNANLFEFQIEILNIVLWVYEERIETRLKLFLDRITLDFEKDKSFVLNMFVNIKLATLQAKDQYNFVIKERLDQYYKESRELLKDLKTQSDLYSSKLRSVLSNWLRDVLAAFASVLFTLYRKNEEKSIFEYSKTLDFVLKALACYYILSICIQMIVDFKDSTLSMKELEYWRDTIRMHLSKEEFDKHIKDSLAKRKQVTLFLYLFIVLFYLLVAGVCFNYPLIIEYFKTIHQ
jgi:adenylate kinase family enzyme